MLSELAIKNFAIIDDIRISFSDGFCVLTGETGAGKSIIIEAVNLLLGGRASSDLVRNGEEYAELEAFFLIDKGSATARIMVENDLDPSEGLIIRRIVALNGRHKIFINSRQSTMQLLKQLAENLASISSQHAHQGLLDEENHLDILDSFAGTWSERRAIQDIYRKLLPMVGKLAELKANVERIIEENEFLRFQINEIEKAAITPGEDEALEAEKNRLSNGTMIYESIQSGINEIYLRDGSVLETLQMIRSDFEKYSSMDPSLSKGAEILSRTVLELEDLTDELRRASDRIDLDPDSMEKTQARLDLIQKLKRKYAGTGGTLEELFRKYEGFRSKISATENISEDIEKMEIEATRLSEELGIRSIALSEKRDAAAAELAALAENELHSLEMENARFRIAVTKTRAAKKNDPQIELFPDETSSDLLTVNGMKINPNGIDRASFLIAPNPGEPPKPLNKIASGGELSRVVLALKAVLTENDPQGTLVFDEVDSGIGGRTADKVGIKLNLLSGKYQILCITHLAQIAKYGKSHYKIEKKVINNRTSTVITPLEATEDRIMEIARMLGGSNISQVTLDHAEEMLRSTQMQ